MGNRGDTLIELIVALVILEIAGSMALAAALLAGRLTQRASEGASADAARWVGYREAELAPACADSAAPRAVPLLLAETPVRPALVATLRCGQ